MQARADEAAALSALVHALVIQALDDLRTGVPIASPDPEVLTAAVWKAAHDGVDGDGIDVLTLRTVPAFDLAEQLVADLSAPLRRLGDEAMVHQWLRQLRADGNGATRQRDRFAAGGDGRAVVAAAVAEFAR